MKSSAKQHLGETKCANGGRRGGPSPEGGLKATTADPWPGASRVPTGVREEQKRPLEPLEREQKVSVGGGAGDTTLQLEQKGRNC